MNNYIRSLCSLLLSLGIILGVVLPVQAASNLAIRLEEPKTPTNDSDFPVTFVVLDMVGGRDVTVSCYRQYEGGPVGSFDTAHVMSANGNTGTCHVTSQVFSAGGTYTLTATAVAGADTASDSVTVTYNTDHPGDPRDYSKNRVDSCHYSIHFKTADDGGKTAKVEVYRSDSTDFTADEGHRVAEIGIGSNTQKDITDTIPDCNKNYYYALRAFNTAGNGSGIVGDEEIKSIEKSSSTTTTTTSTTRQGAIPVSQGQILGVENATSPASPSPASEAGKVLGEVGEVGTENQTLSLFTRFPQLKWILGAGVIILSLVWVRRNRNQ